MLQRPETFNLAGIEFKHKNGNTSSHKAAMEKLDSVREFTFDLKDFDISNIMIQKEYD